MRLSNIQKPGSSLGAPRPAHQG